MQLLVSTAVSFLLLVFSAVTTEAHNITHILAKYPEFSTFNHYLTKTHLAAEVNSRQTVTVCAVNNAAMSDLLSKNLPLSALKNVLSLHVLLDYFGAKKLHQITNGTALSATMYQATGSAPGTSGFVNITDLKGGKVGFGAEENHGNLNSVFVKSVDEIPYNISVIEISQILSSPAAEAPAPSPNEQNLTSLMAPHGCKVFAEKLAATTDAAKTFSDNIASGLTVFCPLDEVFKNFLPKFNNLTANGKVSLLLYHGDPVYQSMAMLKSGNGVQNTLATNGANTFDFTVQNDGEQVTLLTKIVKAKIMNTIFDADPLAIYSVDKVLMPKELFKTAEVPAPAPAPAAEAPKKSKSKSKKSSPPAPGSDDSDSPSPADSDPADQTAVKDSAVRFNGGKTFVAAALSLLLGLFWLV